MAKAGVRIRAQVTSPKFFSRTIRTAVDLKARARLFPPNRHFPHHAYPGGQERDPRGEPLGRVYAVQSVLGSQGSGNGRPDPEERAARQSTVPRRARLPDDGPDGRELLALRA